MKPFTQTKGFDCSNVGITSIFPWFLLTRCIFTRFPMELFGCITHKRDLSKFSGNSPTNMQISMSLCSLSGWSMKWKNDSQLHSPYNAYSCKVSCIYLELPSGIIQIAFSEHGRLDKNCCFHSAGMTIGRYIACHVGIVSQNWKDLANEPWLKHLFFLFFLTGGPATFSCPKLAKMRIWNKLAAICSYVWHELFPRLLIPQNLFLKRIDAQKSESV